jgi:flagellar motor switch protein FliM
MVEQLPMEIVSVLGKTTVPMMDLSRMEVGQLIVLDQRIDQPVTAYVNDSPFYTCWPGKIGKKQALEITACLDQRS